MLEIFLWLSPRNLSLSEVGEIMMSKRTLEIWKMGIVKYVNAQKLQEELVDRRKKGLIPNTLISLQHPPTYTLGKRCTEHNFLVSKSDLKNMGAELHYAERGGDVTFHGPGQAILYPIVSLRELGLGARRYVEGLEDVMTKLASLYGVEAKRGGKGETGVWVAERKIGAIGLRISSGITSHGLAFNINPDLSFFSHIVPCGIPDKEVTSLERESVMAIPGENVITEQLISCFIDIFGIQDAVYKDAALIWDHLKEA